MRNLFWVLLVITAVVPFGLWVFSVGNPLEYFDASVPQGQLLYILSKLAGLVGISLIGLQLAMLHIRRNANNRNKSSRIHWSTSSHKVLGLALCAVVTLHVALFVGAATLRSGHFALGPLTLRFFQGFYDQMISLGALAYYLLLLASVAGVIMYKFGRIHRYKFAHAMLVIIVTVLAVVHSSTVGSETRSLPMIAFYTFLVAIALWSLWHAVANRKRL